MSPLDELRLRRLVVELGRICAESSTMALILRIGRWGYLAMLAGVAAWVGIRWWGIGPLRNDAWALGGLTALFVWGLRFVRLRARSGPATRETFALRRGTKRALLAGLGLLTCGAAGSLVHQVRQGYVELDPVRVIQSDPSLIGGFFAARGRAVDEVLYRMQGSEGQRYLVPLDGYDRRLLVVTTQPPLSTEMRVTGRMRDDLRTVQLGPDGAAEGPFVATYRAAMGLPDDATLYFLDTSIRAGANAQAVVLLLVPIYLALLLVGTPLRKTA